ncbi:GNAT family N-acetyltransferase [Amycolatopsis nigrescens]|uniref:GNAT family N-acetyltransferase n=1 Tax=Amycolatopsis nigrescens TaxID=381445 RepID=UPI00036F1898|nr:GNAT family N-acetyltransferase [Amycolatopsis nigrescens]
MTEHTVRILSPDEHPSASALFWDSLHLPPPSDEDWARAAAMQQPGRTLGVFDPALIGTARSFDGELTVPGGRRVPLAAVTGVGVRADRTRRGALTAMMRFQLTDLAGRGVQIAGLYASEGGIYGRFGYGVGTVSKSCAVDRHRARLRPEVPSGGDVELLPVQRARDQLAEAYASLPHTRPGMMTRPPYWWAGFPGSMHRHAGPMTAALHHGEHGVDGFAVYFVDHESGGDAVLHVTSLHAAHGRAFAGLWRFLLTVDLVDRIKAGMRPYDEPVELLFEDPRCCRITGVEDGLWLRLVDVPAALAARRYYGGPAESVVIEVTDPLLDNNSGRYRVSADGAEPTGEPAQLRLDVATLSMLYLGTWRASRLAGVGRIEVLDPGTPTTADRLFGTRLAAWCGTFF